MTSSNFDYADLLKTTLLSYPEIDITDVNEFDSYFEGNVEDRVVVKREVEGILADKIRRFFNDDSSDPVFVTKIAGVADLGDDDWENFVSFEVEVGKSNFDFEAGTLKGAFKKLVDHIW